jgi:hypothetical protein
MGGQIVDAASNTDSTVGPTRPIARRRSRRLEKNGYFADISSQEAERAADERCPGNVPIDG